MNEMMPIDPVPDIFVSGLGEVEDLGGGCFRFTFFVKRHFGDKELMVPVARLVGPRSAAIQAVGMAAKAVGACLCLQRLMN